MLKIFNIQYFINLYFSNRPKNISIFFAIGHRNEKSCLPSTAHIIFSGRIKKLFFGFLMASCFFFLIQRYFAIQNKLEALQSLHIQIVSKRHVLNNFILLLQLPSYIVATTLNKWRRFRFFRIEVYNNPKQSVCAFGAN